MNKPTRQFFHIHLVSDATGETLTTVADAATAFFADFTPVRHTYALVRTMRQLDHVNSEIERHPGIVLYTIVSDDLRSSLENHCRKLGVPSVSVLDSVISSLALFLNTKSSPKAGRQHSLDEKYFRRIDALNFTLANDDGQHPENLQYADIILLGISRTSKTPTSIFLANKGIKVSNVPFVNGIDLPFSPEKLKHKFIVGLIASSERITQIRRHRLESLNMDGESDYVDRKSVSEELAAMKKICARYDWPMIDVTRRSIEETAAAIMNLYQDKVKS